MLHSPEQLEAWRRQLNDESLSLPHFAPPRATILSTTAASLDELVSREQDNVDSEAVVVFGGKVGKLDAMSLIE